MCCVRKVLECQCRDEHNMRVWWGWNITWPSNQHMNKLVWISFIIFLVENPSLFRKLEKKISIWRFWHNIYESVTFLEEYFFFRYATRCSKKLIKLKCISSKYREKTYSKKPIKLLQSLANIGKFVGKEEEEEEGLIKIN
jgi:hypothetical protein